MTPVVANEQAATAIGPNSRALAIHSDRHGLAHDEAHDHVAGKPRMPMAHDDRADRSGAAKAIAL
jgi:hypothetical protein